MDLPQLQLLSLELFSCPLHGRHPFPGHRAKGVGQGDPGAERYVARWACEGDAGSPLEVGHESPWQDPSEGLAHRWLPGGEHVGHEVPKQRRVTWGNKRRLTLAQAEEDHRHPWPGDEVGRSKTVISVSCGIPMKRAAASRCTAR